MGGIFTNWESLEDAMISDAVDVITTATQRVYETLQENIERAYTAPESPNYKRSGQLMASPQIDGITATRNGVIGQVSISTSTQYDPAGRDTNWIYHAAESDDLWLYGGFWAETESEAREILYEEAVKKFG